MQISTVVKEGAAEHWKFPTHPKKGKQLLLDLNLFFGVFFQHQLIFNWLPFFFQHHFLLSIFLAKSTYHIIIHSSDLHHSISVFGFPLWLWTVNSAVDCSQVIIFHRPKLWPNHCTILRESPSNLPIDLHQVWIHHSKKITSWWFQPIWKILVKLEIFHNLPQFSGENKKYLKPPPTCRLGSHLTIPAVFVVYRAITSVFAPRLFTQGCSSAPFGQQKNRPKSSFFLIFRGCIIDGRFKNQWLL